MAITLKSPREIELIRRAGSVVAKVLSKLQEIAESGVNTAWLDTVARQIAAQNGAQCLFEGVKNASAKKAFPGAICTSVNEQVVHGIPQESVILKKGDILSIDFGAKLNGYCADGAVTIPIGDIDQQKQRLISVTKNALDIAIETAAVGIKWSTIAGKMQTYVEKAGFAVVTDLVGHGIGTKMHEEPQVPNFVSKELLENDIILAEGMVLAVEPMINMGTAAIQTLKDGWTVVTKDGRCSAHFEHTIAIARGGCEVMTRL
jgi:methionyl aminopeptidase